MEKTIDIVIGANYGDCGKGRITSYIANQYDVDKTLVVRSSSGFQCSHTVVSGDKRHIFHGFGSGTLDGYPTYLGQAVVVNPIIFRKEHEELKNMGVNPTIYINKKCYVTLPTHMLANQCVEKVADFFDDRHGTCGIGVWETTNDHICSGTYVNVNKLRNKKFYTKCRKHYGSNDWFKERIYDNFSPDIVDEYDEVHEIVEHYLSLNIDDGMWEHFYNDLCYMYDNCIIVDDILDINDIEHYVFEMSQGILLSSTICRSGGIAHDCTSSATVSIIKPLLAQYPDDKFTINLNYVTRWYMTRHGRELRDDVRRREEISSKIVDNTNVPNEWQGEMDFGLLDIPSFKVRVSEDFMRFINLMNVETHNTNIMVKSIYVTCIDQINNGHLPHAVGHELSGECSLHEFVRLMIEAHTASNIYLCLSESNEDIVPVYKHSNTLPTLKTYIFNGKGELFPHLRSVHLSNLNSQIRRQRGIGFTVYDHATHGSDENTLMSYIDTEDGRRMVQISENGDIYIRNDDVPAMPF